MSIIASTPVPPERRLIDADTVDLAAIPRPRPAVNRFPVLNSGAHRGDERTGQPTGAAFDDGYAHGYADAVRHAVASRPATGSAAGLGVRDVAARLGLSVTEVMDASDAELLAEAARVNPEGVRQIAAALRAGCPPWCQRSHVGEESVFEGWSVGSLHERELAEVTGVDPDLYHHRSVAEVVVEMGTEAGKVIDPTRVVVHLADPDDKSGDRQMGWTGTPEQAEQFAAALLAAAQIVKAER
ncbi:hypothetical protein [Verrucosispora sp. NA02020]|uniref:hypothetical protein n=1 Tax=Verrucosispora sp. NA02020 TaxID=2742132 RepID=UPI003D73932D